MRKRRWRRWLGLSVLAVAVLGPPGFIGVSNLVLLSPIGRAFVAERIQRAILLETSVQGSTWSPWNGFTVYGLLVKQPAPLRKAVSAPLLAAESIRIHTDWRAMAALRISIRSVEIRKPDLAAPIELLSQIPATPVPPAVVTRPPDLAAADPSPPGTSAAPAPVISPPPAVPASEKDRPSAAHSSAQMAPTFWIRISGGRLRIVSAMTKEPLYRIARIDGAIPIGGNGARSKLELAGIRFPFHAVAETVKVPLTWKAPVLGIGVVEGEAFGLGCALEAKIGLSSGIPFAMVGIMPKQEGKEIVLSDMVRAKFGSLAGQGRIQGHLLAPGSWQGQGIIHALAVEADCAGHKAAFDRGHALLMFQGGVLACPDARLVGEETSVLGNATFLSDGRFAGIARIVASPEALANIHSFIQPDGSAPRLTALGTPQRAALDMSVFGFPGNAFFKPHPAAEPIPLR